MLLMKDSEALNYMINVAVRWIECLTIVDEWVKGGLVGSREKDDLL